MRIKAIYQDITTIGEKADAIVNAANKYLLGGGGVDGAIHAAAGPELLKACRKFGGCKPGDAVVTKAFRLKNKYIIHTVGPKYYSDPNPPKTLEDCYRICLELADSLQLDSIAFPSISTGVYGYPIEEAAEICAKVVCEYKGRFLKEAYMCLISHKAVDIYNNAFKKYQNLTKEENLYGE